MAITASTEGCTETAGSTSLAPVEAPLTPVDEPLVEDSSTGVPLIFGVLVLPVVELVWLAASMTVLACPGVACKLQTQLWPVRAKV